MFWLISVLAFSVIVGLGVGAVARALTLNSRAMAGLYAVAFFGFAAFAVLPVWFEATSFGTVINGGTKLVYEVEIDDSGELTANEMAKTAVIIKNRINSLHFARCKVFRQGDHNLEVIVSHTSPEQLNKAKRRFAGTGLLHFLIVADVTEARHQAAISAAKKPENQSLDTISVAAKSLNVNNEIVINKETAETLGRWVELARVNEEFEQTVPNYYDPQGNRRTTIRPFLAEGLIGGPYLFRNADTYEPIAVGQLNLAEPEVGLAELGIQRVEVFMFAGDGQNIRGSDLATVRASVSADGGNEIAFTMTPEGAVKMASLTATYSPDQTTGKSYNMGLVLDDMLLSAPTIQSAISNNGRITGRFTLAEIELMAELMKAGEMPIRLSNEPISETQIAPIISHALWIVYAAMLLAFTLAAIAAHVVVRQLFAPNQELEKSIT